MAKKNKSKKPNGKNGTAKCHSTKARRGAASMQQQSSQRSSACGARSFVKSRDPDTAHANAVLACYASTTCDLPLPSCGVVTAPSQIASALRANDAILVAAVRSSTTTLVRARRDAARAGNERERVDRALLAFDVECGTKIATTTSPRLKTVLAVFKEVSGTQGARAGGRVPPRKVEEVPEGRGR